MFKAKFWPITARPTRPISAFFVVIFFSIKVLLNG
jgi:hypothetical protein